MLRERERDTWLMGQQVSRHLSEQGELEHSKKMSELMHHYNDHEQVKLVTLCTCKRVFAFMMKSSFWIMKYQAGGKKLQSEEIIARRH